MIWLRAFLFLLFLLFVSLGVKINAQEVVPLNVISNLTVNPANIVSENKLELPTANEEVAEPGPEESTLNEPQDLKWVWGEVVSVDPAGTNIKVRYLDYETDSETEAIFIIDKDTVFENIASIESIKTGDSAGIDYNINKDGKNIIKSISIEKMGG
jgi:hypothetical protein